MTVLAAGQVAEMLLFPFRVGFRSGLRVSHAGSLMHLAVSSSSFARAGMRDLTEHSMKNIDFIIHIVNTIFTTRLPDPGRLAGLQKQYEKLDPAHTFNSHPPFF